MFQLLTEFWIPRKDQSIKLHELVESIIYNQLDKNISFIHLFMNTSDKYEFLDNNAKIKIIRTEKRPTYKTLFEYANLMFPTGTPVIIANGDIYFENLEILEGYDLTNKFLCLGRHEINNNKSLYDVPYAQDAWIFQAKIEVPENADFFMGLNGCDNRIAYLMNLRKYELHNPSKDLRIIHNHESDNRTPTLEFIYGPYCILYPTKLNEEPRVQILNSFKGMKF